MLQLHVAQQSTFCACLAVNPTHSCCVKLHTHATSLQISCAAPDKIRSAQLNKSSIYHVMKTPYRVYLAIKLVM